MRRRIHHTSCHNKHLIGRKSYWFIFEKETFVLMNSEIVCMKGVDSLGRGTKSLKRPDDGIPIPQCRHKQYRSPCMSAKRPTSCFMHWELNVYFVMCFELKMHDSDGGSGWLVFAVWNGKPNKTLLESGSESKIDWQTMKSRQHNMRISANLTFSLGAKFK